jgi:cytochrome b involved in lipid metabolism
LAESQDRTLILISGFIHDVSSFVDSHPGGRQLLFKSTGLDMTAGFFGGVYAHSNAAHNVRRDSAPRRMSLTVLKLDDASFSR